MGSCSDACGAGELLCGASCVDPQTNNDFCGATDNCTGSKNGGKCPAGNVCTNGKCKVECDGGFVKCGDECINPINDPDYCGATAACEGNDAGKKCGADQVCSESVCRDACENGKLKCGDRCIDPLSSVNFCGAKGNCKGDDNDGDVCAVDEVCSVGQCHSSCASGLVLCGRDCIDPEVDEQHCGAGMNCAADPGDVCTTDEECLAGKCQQSCTGGKVLCSGKCIDPLIDDDFCGASGNCAGTNAGKECSDTQVCKIGKCDDRCKTGEVLCGGFCIDPTRSQLNCGAKADCIGANAGTACKSTEICDVGVCALSCTGGTIPCKGNCIDPDSDVKFCGAKNLCIGADDGEQCDSGEKCDSGLCVLDCRWIGPGWNQCGTGMAAVCKDWANDEFNCGGCGKLCMGSDLCVAGTCEKNCAAGTIKCGAVGSETCIDPATSPSNEKTSRSPNMSSSVCPNT